jgi:septum formation protein
MTQASEWILASGSPRRRELLARLQPHFRVLTSEVEEWEPDEADPGQQVLENARRKGQVIAERHPEALVIAADTTVALGRRIFSKPVDDEDAVRMLQALSGEEHAVLTGVCLFHEGRSHAFVEASRVRFRVLDEATIAAYLDRVHVLDKAGGYGIQDSGDLIIERYEGSFENIMGLPVQRLRAELVQLDWLALPALPTDA